jgi:hypothetical protein
VVVAPRRHRRPLPKQKEKGENWGGEGKLGGWGMEEGEEGGGWMNLIF